MAPREFPLPSDKVTPVAAAVLRALRSVRTYHRHQVVGIEHVPPSGPALIAVNHSLATYDGLLLAVAIYEANGRVPAALGDNLLFQLPIVRDLAPELFIMPASPENGERLLKAGRLVYVAPGGMREALRSHRDRYAVRWSERKGFARLALRTGAPLLLAACPAADDLYVVYGNRITNRVYERFKIPLPIFRGLGPTWWPRPIPLVHTIAPPIVPPARDPEKEEAQVDELHARAIEQMADLMTRY